MSFVHDDRDFDALVRIVADKRGLSLVLVEKDYWVTHTLWTLLQSGFEVWLKGGTSRSKGFSLIERFSEDLDLKIEPGRVVGVAAVRSWTSEGKVATRERETYFSSLASNLDVAGADVVLEVESADRSWRSANLRVVFPQRQQDELVSILRPFVLLEVGSARVALLSLVVAALPPVEVIELIGERLDAHKENDDFIRMAGLYLDLVAEHREAALAIAEKIMSLRPSLGGGGKPAKGEKPSGRSATSTLRGSAPRRSRKRPRQPATTRPGPAVPFGPDSCVGSRNCVGRTSPRHHKPRKLRKELLETLRLVS